MNVDGGTISQSGNTPLHLASGKTFTASNNAQINTELWHLNDGTTYNIQSGADLLGSTYIAIGTATVTVDGIGSTLNTGISSGSYWGYPGTTANVTYRNAASGALGEIRLAAFDTAGTSGTLRIESNADVTCGYLLLATEGGSTTTANIVVEGSGSTLTQTGSSILTIGHASTGTANITVSNSGVFTSGTGDINIYKTGQINVTGGAFNANGNVIVDGGALTRSGTGAFNLASGKTLTASNNAQIGMGSGAALSGDTNWIIQSGADLFASGQLDIGTSGGTTNVTVDGAGSTLIQSGSSNIGHASMGAVNLTVSNGGVFASGFGNINIYKTGQVNVTSGAFFANGNVAVDGGKITRSGAGEFYLASGKTLTASNNAQIDVGSWFLGGGTTWNIQSAPICSAVIILTLAQLPLPWMAAALLSILEYRHGQTGDMMQLRQTLHIVMPHQAIWE